MEVPAKPERHAPGGGGLALQLEREVDAEAQAARPLKGRGLTVPPVHPKLLLRHQHLVVEAFEESRPRARNCTSLACTYETYDTDTQLDIHQTVNRRNSPPESQKFTQAFGRPKIPYACDRLREKQEE